MQKIVFTLCSNNYLAQAKTLGESVAKFLPEARFVIGLIDKIHPEIDYVFFKGAEILPYFELGFDEFDEMVERYNIVEFNTAVKPFYIDHFFKHTPDSIVYYIDPDIELFDSFHELERAFSEGYDFILTPHLVTPQKAMSKFEKLILNVGIYNLGFLGIRNSENSRVFVNWWKERLRYNCKIDFAAGLFVDQIWVNYLPGFFNNVFIVRNPGYNIGYWNFHERYLQQENGVYKVNEKFNLYFFHFSSYNPLMPERLCKWLDYSFNERPDLLSIYQAYEKKLIQNKYKEFSKVERLLNFKKNHPYADRKSKSFKSIKKYISKLLSFK
jgi:hypothetical protein